MKKFFLLALWAVCALAARADYSGTPVIPQQVTAQNYATLGFSASDYSSYIGYYAIRNAEELYGFTHLVCDSNKISINGVLMADIVVNSHCVDTAKAGGTPAHEWIPIGTSDNQYGGRFDGRGHTVSGLYRQNTNRGSYPTGGNNMGLFGNTQYCTIRNVVVSDCYFYGYGYVGPLAGHMSYESQVHHCACINCFVKAYNEIAGGVVGGMYSQTVLSACYSNARVEGTRAGGFVGYTSESTIKVKNSFFFGSIYCQNGAYAGYAFGRTGGTVEHCYYLEGCGTCDYGTMKVSENDAAVSGCSSFTAAQALSGELCWKLNQGLTADAFFQLIGTDTLPHFASTGSNTVYASGTLKCDGTLVAGATFGNTSGSLSTLPHTCVDGLCTVCGHCDSTWMSPNAQGVYEIATPAQLYWFAAYVNQHNASANACLTADITLNTGVLKADGTLNTGSFRLWTPIGTDSHRYSGTFDGRNHTISGLYAYYEGSVNYPLGGVNVGLFGYIGSGTVRNITLLDSYVVGDEAIGGICGYANYGSIIENCHSAATVTHVKNGYGMVGGICGQAFYGNIRYCRFSGLVKNDNYFGGGIVAYSRYSTISSCLVDGRVKGEFNNFTGAIVSCLLGNDATLCYALDSCATRGTSILPLSNEGGVKGSFIPRSALASGKAAWLLNGQQAASNIQWRQTLGTQAVPGFVGDTVYYVLSCAGDSTYRNINVNGHLWLVDAAAVPATCTAAGSTEAHHCSFCSAAETAAAIPALGHDTIIDATHLAATCTTAGHTAGRHCSRCSEITIVSSEIPALGHDTIVDVTALAATCTTAGHTEGHHCSRCDGITSVSADVPALGHDTVIDAALAATCTTAGHTAGRHCSRCSEITVVPENIPALGHDTVIDASLAATCTEAGHTAGHHCSRCSEITVVPADIPALGHDFQNYVYNNDATTEADGTETAHCERTGCTAEDTRTAEGTRIVEDALADELSGDAAAFVAHHILTVTNAQGIIRVFDANGHLVVATQKAAVHAHTEIELSAHGVYIVTADNLRTRVVVR